MLFCDPVEEGSPRPSGHHFLAAAIGFIGSIGLGWRTIKIDRDE